MAVRPIDGDALRKELTCNFAGEPFHGNRKVRRIIESMPTLTQPTIGHCKDCDNWDEEFSAGRKSLNNYVCFCSEWSDPENGYKRYTPPSDYCSYFIPKEALYD